MNVFLYVRVSTAEQAKEGYSIQEQIERLHSFCKAMKWTPAQVFNDAGYSGASTDRPDLNRMIQAVKAGKADKVLVYKLDRLSRSQLDTLYLIEKVFLANNTDFVSMSENFDTATPFGRAMIGILAVFAQLEREQIKERMQMGKEARAKEGKYSGNHVVPVGYDYDIDNDRLVVNEYEKMQVLEVFQLFFAGTSIKKMIQIFDEKGYRHKHGSWNDKTIRNVMRSKTYLGFLMYRGQWYPANHDPIITEDMHKKAVKMLDQRKEAYLKNHRPGKVQSYLGGLLVCKWCGAKYTKKSGYKNKDGKQNCYYYCNSRVKQSPKSIKDPNCKNKNWRMDDLDNAILDEIRKLSVDPRYLEQLKEKKKNNPRPDIIRSELEKLDTQLEKVIDIYTYGNIPFSAVQGKINSINKQKESLSAELDRIEREDETGQELAADAIRSFGEALDNGSFQQIRAIIETLIEYIELDGETVNIHWNFT